MRQINSPTGSEGVRYENLHRDAGFAKRHVVGRRPKTQVENGSWLVVVVVGQCPVTPDLESLILASPSRPSFTLNSLENGHER